MKNPDVLIVGAGPVGCVLAERLANDLNFSCLIIEKRNHIAGNCYDKINDKKLLFHKYGPHYLRFKNKKTFNYLSKFTKWIPGNYIVKSIIKDELYPIPINRDTLEKFFNVKFNSKTDIIKFLNKKRIKIKNPKNSEEQILSSMGKEIYEAFYKNYTIKQWGIHPTKLSKSITGRLPIRYNRNPYYVEEKLRFMPKNGFTKMFKKMLQNKKIDVQLNTDFFKIRNSVVYRKLMIYTGEPDRFFSFKYGKLKWRSLKFKFRNYKKEYIQNCVQYNYPNDNDYTRSVEIKHVTKQKSKFTVISKEFPTNKGEPYYPFLDKTNLKKYKKYENLINKAVRNNIYFEGRLAKYKYFNTDEVIENALELFKKIKKKYKVNKI